MRPSCDKILESEIVKKKITRHYPEKIMEESLDNILLKTIRLPKNLLYLTDKLPSSTYDIPIED